MCFEISHIIIYYNLFTVYKYDLNHKNIQFFYFFEAGMGVEPNIFSLWGWRLNRFTHPQFFRTIWKFPYFPYYVEMGGVEPPSWQQCHKVIHKFSWFLFLPTKSTFLNSFILASRLSVVIPTIVLPIVSPLYPLSEVREWCLIKRKRN